MVNLKGFIEPVLLAIEQVGFCIEDLKKDNKYKDNPKELALFADMQAHELLSKLLKKILDVLVVSEEDVASHSIDEEVYWLIDPIDGTSSYSNKYNGYVVQCALIKSNIPILSAIYAPHFKKFYYAYENGGAWMNGKNLANNFIINDNVRSLTDNEPTPHGIAAVVYKRLNFEKYIESGSLGLKMCLVAEGTASAFVKSTKVRDWDIAPASLILKEINGIFTDSHSKYVSYAPGARSHHGLIATRDIHLHNQIASVITKERVNGYFK